MLTNFEDITVNLSGEDLIVANYIHKYFGFYYSRRRIKCAEIVDYLKIVGFEKIDEIKV